MTEQGQSELTHTMFLRARLSAAWASVMFLYAYGDLLGFYDQTLLEAILQGNMPMLGPITPQLRLGIAMMMSVPSLMVFACFAVKRTQFIWTNIVFGILYSLIILMTLVNAPLYYKYFGLLESGLTVYITLVAYQWRHPGNNS